MLIKYIKSVLWRVAKRLSYIQDARCLKVNLADSICLVRITRMKIFVLCQEYTEVETLFLKVAMAEAVIRRPLSRGTKLFPTSGGHSSTGRDLSS